MEGDPRRARSSQLVAKRVADVVVATGVLTLATPFLLVAAAAIALEDGRPVFFAQTRVGLHGRRFRLWKLRSMRTHDLTPDEIGQVRGRHHLVTRTGALIRRLKLDELPQLVNVLRGEMSLVGPRPALPQQVSEYDGFQRRRLEVRPGMTGWAQVNGNVALTWEDRILLDVWYVDHWSLMLDLRILVRTLAVVAAGENPRESEVKEARAYAERARGNR